jgi:hypothetical protein
MKKICKWFVLVYIPWDNLPRRRVLDLLGWTRLEMVMVLAKNDLSRLISFTTHPCFIILKIQLLNDNYCVFGPRKGNPLKKCAGSA